MVGALACGGTNTCGPWKTGGLGAGKCPGGIKFLVAYLETLILVDEVKGLPVVLGTSNVVSDGVEANDCTPGSLRHLPDHHVFADESARTNRQVAAKQVEGVPRSLAEDEEAWYENRRTDKS